MRFSTFFEKSKAVFQKWTFIFVHFSKIENTFEKTLHHSLFKLFCSISPKYLFIVFFIFMIPKRKNHTLPNVIAAAPCAILWRGNVCIFLEFHVVTENALKC